MSINFVIGLSVSTNGKDKSYDSILVIVNCLIKIVHFEPIKVTIDIPSLEKVIINVVVHYHNIFNSIITDSGLLFILKV